MSDEQHKASAPGDQSAAPSRAMFTCASCGHSQSLPEQLLGRQAKCPQCGKLGQVVRPPHTPTEGDVRLDDLVEADAAAARPRQPSPSQGLLALESAERPQNVSGRIRHFFSGSPPLNLLAGTLGGVHVCLVCLALSMLVFTVSGASRILPHALLLTLVPAVLGSVFFALHGRLAVAVGAPDPSAVLSVFLILAALGADLVGRVAEPNVTATLLAALSLAGILAGVCGLLLSRLGLAEHLRYLPGEVMGGMLAGFGLLLIKAWVQVMLAYDPSLAFLATLHYSELGPALAQTSASWGPPVAFGLLYFLVHMSVRGIVWPLALTALAVGGWNFLVWNPAVLSGPLVSLSSVLGLSNLAGLPALHANLPQMLDVNCALTAYVPENLSRIDWQALLGRAEVFAAAIALAIIPSITRTSILESVLERDAGAEGQMRVVGASTLFSGVLGALPSSLSLSSSLGMRALGASGPLAGFTAGMVCLGFLLAGQPVLAYIPTFVPLGLLLGIGLTMPMSWMLRDARNPLSRKDDLRAAWVSCLLVALLGPVLGVFLSLGLGIALSLSRAVSGGGIRSIQSGDVFHSNVDRSPSERRTLRERGGQILVLRLRGFLFLGTLYGLVRTIQERLGGSQPGGLKFVLLDFTAVSGLGASAAIGFKRLESLARQRGLLLFLTSVPLEMEEHLEGLGYRLDEGQGVCRLSLNLDYALEWCEDSILAEAGALEQSQDTLEDLLAATFPEPSLVPTLIKCLERVEVPKKRHIIQQGDPSDCMYFLQSGKVHVELALPGGKVLRLKKMGPGTVFGEMGIYTSAPRSASVIALERCVVYKLSLERFKLIQTRIPLLAAAVNRFVVTLLAERVAEENAKTRAT